MMERELNRELNDNFNVAGDEEKQFGKTVVLYGYSKKTFMHATVYLGTDKEGNSYYFSKGGKINAPKIVKSKDPNKIKNFIGYGEVQNYYNPKK